MNQDVEKVILPSFGVDDSKPVSNASVTKKQTSKVIAMKQESDKGTTTSKRKPASKKMVPPQLKRIVFATEDIHSWSSSYGNIFSVCCG